MARHLETLITNVREREAKRRRVVYLIGAATLCAFLSVTVTLASWYPLWASLVWSALVIPLAIFLARGEYPSLSVSSEYASAIIDSHAALKGRVITYTSLSRSAAAPDTLYRSFIAEQVALAQPPIPPVERLVSLQLTRHQRVCVAVSLGCLILTISLLLARPRTPYEAIADQLVATLDRHPELPEEVRVAVSDLAREIAQGDASIDELSAAIDSAQDDVTRALAEESVAQGKEIAAPQGKGVRERSRPSPLPTSTPQASSTNERKQEQEEQSSKGDQGKSGEKPSAEGAGKSQERQGSSPSQSSQSQKGSSQSESKNDGAEQKESQGASGEQESQDAKEQESGSGQGAGQGAGSGSSGSGSQQSDGAQQQEGKGSGDGKGKGQGAGSDQNEQGAQDQTSGKSGAQSGRPQESASGSQSGLEDLQQSLNQAQQELKKQEESAQKSAGSQSSAQGEKEGQKGEAKNSQRGSAQGKDQGKEEGKDQGKEQGGSRSGAGEKQPKDSSKEAQSDKSTQGSQGAGNEGSSQKEKNQSNPESKGESGKGEGERPQDNQSQEEGDEREPQDGKSEGVGERSSLPDRSATARVEDQSAEGGESASGDGAPKTFKESEITSKDEAFDARYTGADSSLEKSSKEAQPKVSLEDVTLAKPKGSSQRGEQPIPLEYKGILE